MTKEQVSEYFEQVAAENARLAIASPGDLRSIINAIIDSRWLLRHETEGTDYRASQVAAG